MAITPEEAGKVSDEERAAADEAEADVSRLLSKYYQGTGSVRITGTLCKLSERCRDEVLRRSASMGIMRTQGGSHVCCGTSRRDSGQRVA